MAVSSVTVSASLGNDKTLTLTFPSDANLLLAQQIAAAISTEVTSGAVQAASSLDGRPPTLGGGMTGAFFQETGGRTVLPDGYNDIVDTASKPTSIRATSDSEQKVMLGSGGVTLTAPSGSGGTIVSAGGNNDFRLHGSWLVSAEGSTTIRATAGHDTIEAMGARTVVLGSRSDFLFLGGAGGATVIGGTGSDTIIGGSGPLVAHGGTDGHNFIAGGTGPATLFGGGNRDVLQAQGLLSQTLVAASGSETLAASTSTGRAGDIFEFARNVSGHYTIQNFKEGLDELILPGFGSRAIGNAIATETSHNGSVTLTLPDRVTITFSNVEHLTARDLHG